MSKQKKQNSKKRQRIQTVEQDTKSIPVSKLTKTRFDYYLWILVAVVVLLIVLVWRGIASKPARNYNPDNSNAIALTAPIATKSDLAKVLESRLSFISPTPATGNLGFIATEISFTTNNPYAYITYTDTHITLRMLVEYVYNSNSLSTKVLATFIPNEKGDWQLQYGKDLQGRVVTEDYVYDAASDKWISSDTNNAN